MKSQVMQKRISRWVGVGALLLFSTATQAANRVGDADNNERSPPPLDATT